ncbi:MAG: HD domain-containing protein [Ruminiclostridium sp.]|nr:HD domain-containing protein [Ruminiclostridium sp.]
MGIYKRKNIWKHGILFLIFSFLFVISYFLAKQRILSFDSEKPVITGLLIFAFLTSLFFAVSIAIRHKRLLNELKHTELLASDIREEKYTFAKGINAKTPVIDSINRAIINVAESKKNQLSQLCKRTEQLDEINTELNDAYMQLESSYGQLEAVMDQLNESEKRYHSLVVNIPDIVLSLDSSGNITYANRACREVLKFRRQDIVGKPFQYIIHPSADEKFDMTNLKQNIEKIGNYNIDIPLCKKDGSLILTEIKFTEAIESPEMNFIQAIIRDVTEQKRIEKAMVETNARLKIINNLNHNLVSTTELTDIYKTCVNSVTKEMEFLGCMYLVADKKERHYRIMEYSGEYFRQPGNLEQFYNIRCNSTLFTGKNSEGIVLEKNMLFQYFSLSEVSSNQETDFSKAFILELSSYGEMNEMFIVITKDGFMLEEIEALRSIGHSTAVAVEKTINLIESKNNFVKTIDALVAAIEARDQYTKGHSQRVSALAVKIACKLGMSKQQVEELRIAGILHDIGKVGISDSILLKKGSLTNDEYEEIKKHPAISNKILYSIGLSERILKAVAFHHERFDGGGYPFGLTDESLGYEPQIIAVADAFDAMTSLRPYKKPMSWQMAVCELERCKGSQFHPGIVDVMVHMLMEENSTEVS